MGLTARVHPFRIGSELVGDRRTWLQVPRSGMALFPLWQLGCLQEGCLLIHLGGWFYRLTVNRSLAIVILGKYGDINPTGM